VRLGQLGDLGGRSSRHRRPQPEIARASGSDDR
jgi:hypothetical protein